MAERMSLPGDGPGSAGRRPYHNSAKVEIDDALRVISELGPPSATMGVVLGSGLGAFAEQLSDAVRVPFGEIPHMPVPDVPGHAGRLCYGRVADVQVVCLQGRLHLYEGHPVARVVFGCRLLAALGCRSILLTNAAGGIRLDLAPGSFMLITDHLNLTGENPLVGVADPFVDMTDAYDPSLCRAARRAANDVGIHLPEGVYAGLRGPSYETPAEIRMLRNSGADAVGMSTVLETIALRHMGVRVGALSCITNYAAGISRAALDHSDVQDVARRAEESLVKLLGRWVELAAHETKGRSE